MTDKMQAYHALQFAAEKIGSNNYRSGRYRVTRNCRGEVIEGYTITTEHRLLVDAMRAVLAGTMTPEEGMALLHDHDVMKQRFPEECRS